MIPLPPGCTVSYDIRVEIDTMTDDIIEWYKLIGGVVAESTDQVYDFRGRHINKTFLSYNGSRPCHYFAGSSMVKLNFKGADASVASMFLLKFHDKIVSHNLEEMKRHVY